MIGPDPEVEAEPDRDPEPGEARAGGRAEDRAEAQAPEEGGVPATCHCISVYICPSQVENTARVRFRKVQFDRKVTEQEERRRAAVRGDHEREVESITVSTVSIVSAVSTISTVSTVYTVSTVSIDTILSTHHI